MCGEVLGGLNVSSHSRAPSKASGEIQRGAGTVTWSRVSCRAAHDVFIIRFEHVDTTD
jgi:hypothetical protein